MKVPTAVLTPPATLSAVSQPATASQVSQEVLLTVGEPPMLVRYPPVVPTRCVKLNQEMLSDAHVKMALSRDQTLFRAVPRREIPVNRILVVMEQSATPPAIHHAIVQAACTEIRTQTAHLPGFNYADQVHVGQTLIVIFRMAAKSVNANTVSKELHTTLVTPSSIHAYPRPADPILTVEIIMGELFVWYVVVTKTNFNCILSLTSIFDPFF